MSREGSFRRDPLTGRWVVISGARRGMTVGLRPRGLPDLFGPCPFCPGNEAESEPPVLEVPDDGPWQIRVVRNRYPWVRLDAAAPSVVGAEAPMGVHEVVIDTPDHGADLPDLDAAHVARLLGVYRDRLLALSMQEGVRQVNLFRNRGRRAGSSQPHPHGQILAAAVPSPELELRHGIAAEHYRRTGRRLLADVLEEELADGTRVVERDGDLTVLCPFAPRENHQVWIVQRGGQGSFATVPDGDLLPLARILQRTVVRVRKATGGADYNLVWRVPRVGAESEPASSWYLDLLPRRGGDAGLELSSGMTALTVSPETAAAELRQG